ncbi:hypothetical protein WME75_26235 [Sorangium sp. So ce1014]|uniref:hypothetical protein n=1 Tax=Sorangium sp. So ce1014 TaxID=3133326 RepID=UPI003F61321C
MPKRQPLGVRQYLGLTLLGGIAVTLGAVAVTGARGTEPASNTYIERGAPPPPSAPPPPPVPTQDPAVGIRAIYEAQYAGAKPEDRASAVRACMLGSACPQAQVDGIIAAGAHEREREELRRLSHAWGAHVAAKGGTDGEQLSAVAVAAAALQLEECGIAELKKLDWTTQGEADKDIGGARGRMINVYGRVNQIRKDGELHWGTMGTAAGWVYFVVVGATKGVVSGRHAEIAGMVVQRYNYANTMGGLTDSILVVGRARGQADSDKPLPPAPTRSAVLAPVPTGPRKAATALVTSGAPPSSTWDLPFAPPGSIASAHAAAPSAPPPERWSGALDDRPPPPKAPAPPEAAAAPPGPATAAAEN